MRILDYQHSFSYVGGTYTAYLKPNVINASVDSLYSGTVDQGSEYLYEYTYTQEELGEKYLLYIFKEKYLYI